MGDYLNPEGSEEEMEDIRSFVHIEVTVQGDETEDVETLKTHEAPIENVPLLVASMEPVEGRLLK